MEEQPEEKRDPLYLIKDWRNWKRHHIFGVGLIIGVIVGSVASSLYWGFTRQPGVGGTEAVIPLSIAPRIFRVIPETASVGDEIIIRGGKFGSRGKVCFRNCSSEFEVLAWTSGSVRARVSSVASGSGDLWIVDGDGQESSKISFEVEE